MGNFGCDCNRLREAGKLAFVGCCTDAESVAEVSADYVLASMLLRIKEAIRKTGGLRIGCEGI